MKNPFKDNLYHMYHSLQFTVRRALNTLYGYERPSERSWYVWP